MTVHKSRDVLILTGSNSGDSKAREALDPSRGSGGVPGQIIGWGKVYFVPFPLQND